MILMNDFKADPPLLRKAMMGAIERVLASGWYILGNEVKAFESQWAKACGVAHGVGVGNGMDAIEIALRALNIGKGDEVITTPMTAFASVLAIIRAGATPVLADINPDTALMSIESAKRCITEKTKAVLLVHLYGQILGLDEWQTFCKHENLYLIEDCAQAHLASWRGKCAGSFGEAGAFSFYPTKNLGAIGDAGMLVTQNDDVAKQADQLRNYGQSERYHHPEIGMNSRLDELHAAMLIERLKWLPEWTTRRQTIAQSYYQGISHPGITLLTPPEELSAHVYHLFVIKSINRAALIQHLQGRGVQSLIHYPIPIHEQKPCINIARDPHGLRCSEQHARECLSIPCHPQMTENEVQTVIDAINGFEKN